MLVAQVPWRNSCLTCDQQPRFFQMEKLIGRKKVLQFIECCNMCIFLSVGVWVREMILQAKRAREVQSAEEHLMRLKLEAEDFEKKERIKLAYLQDEGYSELGKNGALRKAIENQVSCCGQQIDLFIDFQKLLQPPDPPLMPDLFVDPPILPAAGRLGESAEQARFREDYHLLVQQFAKFRDESTAFAQATEFLSHRSRDFAEKALQSNWSSARACIPHALFAGL